MMADIYNVTKEDMHRDPVEAWRVDRMRERIATLRKEIVRLKRKCGESLTAGDIEPW